MVNRLFSEHKLNRNQVAIEEVPVVDQVLMPLVNANFTNEISIAAKKFLLKNVNCTYDEIVEFLANKFSVSRTIAVTKLYGSVFPMLRKNGLQSKFPKLEIYKGKKAKRSKESAAGNNASVSRARPAKVPAFKESSDVLAEILSRINEPITSFHLHRSVNENIFTISISTKSHSEKVNIGQ